MNTSYWIIKTHVHAVPTFDTYLSTKDGNFEWEVYPTDAMKFEGKQAAVDFITALNRWTKLFTGSNFNNSMEPYLHKEYNVYTPPSRCDIVCPEGYRCTRNFNHEGPYAHRCK